MKILIGICISFVFISIALILIWLIKNIQPLLTPSGYLILTIGGSVNLIIGISLFLTILYQFARRKTEELTPERVREILKKEVRGLGEEDIEGKLLFGAGSIAAYLKRRGTVMTRLTKEGEYLPYENFKEGLRLAIEDVMEEFPGLRYKSYTLPLLKGLKTPYVGKVLENLSEKYEIYKRIGINYFPRKSLKSLADIFKRYVR